MSYHKDNATIHDISYTSEYKTWCSIKQRCHNDKCYQYKTYGGRNIKLAEYWMNNPLDFYNYIISLDNYNKEGYTLDRIDNNKDYTIGNLRWASKFTQSNNRSIKSATGYSGVYKNGSGYIARVFINKVKKNIGTFLTAEIANENRVEYLKKYNYV
jgi:hypothetical protein